MTTTHQNNKTSYQCKLCKQVYYKNANGLVRHILSIHKNISIEEYYMEYVSIEDFRNIKIKKIKSNENLERYLTNICLECKEPKCKLNSFGKGFSIFCSESCTNKNIEHNENKKDKTKKALVKKYGVNNPSLIVGNTEKIKRTKIKKYGDESYINRDKQIQTLKERYGDNITSYTQTNEYKSKVKETSLIKYGVEHFTKSNIVKDKQRETFINNYGVEYNLQDPEIRKRIENTNLEKYGVKSLLSLKEVKDKALIEKNKKFIERLSNFKFDNVRLIDPEKRLFSCLRCNNSFVQEDIVLSKSAGRKFPRCINCFPIKNRNISLLQQEFASFLTQNNVSYVMNERKLFNNRIELDFYMPQNSLAIELNGLFYHSENFGNKNKNYHLNKTNLCNTLGIRLIHIYSDEWEFKKEIVKSKILHILKINKNKHKIYGRDCYIDKVEINTKNVFLIRNHIEGADTNSKHVFGAYNKITNELITLITFNNTNNKDIYEISRIASNIDYVCTSTISKLLNHSIKVLRPKRLKTYVDRRWSNENNLFKTLNFTLTSIVDPDFYYLSPKTNYKLRHKELDFKQERIWDCGKLEYILEI